MQDPNVVVESLIALYRRLLGSPPLEKGREWKGEWDGWDRGRTWHPEKEGVYVLWQSKGDHEAGRPPVYVGEGLLGPRIWESFTQRPRWRFAQFLVDDRISGPGDDCRLWRKALERLSILILNPEENRS